jgi:hypothetical protein
LSSGAPAPQASGSLANIVSGALVTYSSFSLSESKVYPSNIEFDVVGYEELVDDLDTNPVLDRSTDDTIYNTTGKFLVLKDKNIPAFSKNAIVNGSRPLV